MQPPRPTLLDRTATELGLALTPDQRAGIGHEQLRLVLLHTRVGTLAATLFVVLMAWHYRGQVPAGQVDAWIAVKLLVSAARMALARAYQRHQQQGPAGNSRLDIGHWQRWSLALMVLDGAVLGLGAWRMMGEPMVTTALVVAAVDAMGCVATFGLQVHLGFTAAYVTPMLLATAVGLVQRQDEVASIASIGQLILLALLLATAAATSRRLASGMLLRLQAQALAAEKAEALQLAQQQIALRSQFLAKLSHELRTPLHGILGLARLLHLESRDLALTRRVELIEFSGTHLLGLINDLLDVSRSEAGRFVLGSARFELLDQATQVAEVFALRAADRGLDFRWEPGIEGPHWVLGDAIRLRQVLHNLLGNAIKFTAQGEVRLRLQINGDSISFEVSDTGPGLSLAEQQRIFQPFHQADPVGEGPTDGVGLGLTIAREIALAMGGDVQVRSRPGAGATFVFTARLPPAPEPASIDHGAAANGATAVAGPPHGLPNRVLVAEDDEVSALIVCSYLERLGVPHEHVADGKQAVSRALRETQRPQLVLMDCRMPVLDGLAATREIRAQERTLALPRIPILALTATTSPADQAECLAAGMDAVVAKPFTLEQLSAALHRAPRA